MTHKILYPKLFTPPRFLEMPSVSVSIFSAGISFFTLKATDKGLIPDIYGLEPLPEGSFSNGRVVKKDLVVKALINIRKKTKVDFVRFSIPEEETYIFKTHLPNLKPKEINDILEFKIEENVPLSVKESVFDYEVIPNNRKASELDIIVSVTSLGLVEDLEKVFLQSGLTPVLFSPESNNVAKTVVKEANEQYIVVVNIKENNIVFSLVIFGVVYQTQSINFGSATITSSIAKYFKVSFAEAEKIKKEKLYNDSDLSVEIFLYLVNTVSAIKDELYKFISFCNELEFVVGQIERVILCGRDAMIIGLEEYLTSSLNIKVEIANIWINNFDINTFIPQISRLDSEDLAVVNGLSLY